MNVSLGMPGSVDKSHLEQLMHCEEAALRCVRTRARHDGRHFPNHGHLKHRASSSPSSLSVISDGYGGRYCILPLFVNTPTSPQCPSEFSPIAGARLVAFPSFFMISLF